MSAVAFVSNRGVALDVAALAMSGDAREVPLVPDGQTGRRFVGAAVAFGSTFDVISGQEREFDTVGMFAITVSGGRLLGILAPTDSSPATWFTCALGEITVDVVDVTGIRRKPRTLEISFGGVTMRLTEVGELLRKMMQPGQADGLLETLLDRSDPASNTVFESPSSRLVSTGTLTPPDPQQTTSGTFETPAQPQPSAGGRRQTIGPLVVEVRADDRPARSALWDVDASADARGNAVDRFLQPLVEAGYPERFIVYAFLDPVITVQTPDGLPPADVWAADPVAHPAGARDVVLPPTAVPFAQPLEAFETVCAGTHPAVPWLRRLLDISKDPDTATMPADRLRYLYRTRKDTGRVLSSISFGDRQRAGELGWNDRGIVARLWAGPETGPERAWIVVVPIETIRNVRFRAIYPVKVKRFGRSSDETAQLVRERGYGELSAVEVLVDSNDGWRDVGLSCVLRQTGGEEALLRFAEQFMERLAAGHGGHAGWTPLQLMSSGSEGYRDLGVAFDGAVAFGVDRAALGAATG